MSYNELNVIHNLLHLDTLYYLNSAFISIQQFVFKINPIFGNLITPDFR